MLFYQESETPHLDFSSAVEYIPLRICMTNLMDAYTLDIRTPYVCTDCNEEESRRI
jgi:hypothetical protein